MHVRHAPQRARAIAMLALPYRVRLAVHRENNASRQNPRAVRRAARRLPARRTNGRSATDISATAIRMRTESGDERCAHPSGAAHRTTAHMTSVSAVHALRTPTFRRGRGRDSILPACETARLPHRPARLTEDGVPGMRTPRTPPCDIRRQTTMPGVGAMTATIRRPSMIPCPPCISIAVSARIGRRTGTKTASPNRDRARTMPESPRRRDSLSPHTRESHEATPFSAAALCPIMFSVTRMARRGCIFGIVPSIAVVRKINDQTHDAALMEVQQLPEQFVACDRTVHLRKNR